MAQRRMFSKDIVRSDAFLDMPTSSQLLYFHLGMEADDDGFVDNSKTVARMVNTTDDDMKILLAKRFLLPCSNGVIVLKHWRINNYIQSDRYKPTKYIEDKKRLIIKENQAYTECIQPVSTLDTQVRLGKSKVREGKSEEAANAAQEIPLIIDAFKTVNPSYSKWFANTTQRGACERMIKTHGLERLKEIIALLHTTNGKRYFPTITTPLQLEDGMAKLEAALRRAQEPELANKRGFVM